MVDIKTLEALAHQLDLDATRIHALNVGAMRSVAEIIRTSIGAPINWPSRVAGTDYADAIYSGSPSLRLAFNHGVKWAVEHYEPSASITVRYANPWEFISESVYNNDGSGNADRDGYEWCTRIYRRKKRLRNG